MFVTFTEIISYKVGLLKRFEVISPAAECIVPFSGQFSKHLVKSKKQPPPTKLSKAAATTYFYNVWQFCRVLSFSAAILRSILVIISA